MGWREEHGPLHGMPPFVDWLVERGHLTDESWHNDVNPSFSIPEDSREGDMERRLFIEPEVSAVRASPRAPRFFLLEEAGSKREGDFQEIENLETALQKLMGRKKFEKAVAEFVQAFNLTG